MAETGQITQWLGRLQDGDDEALDSLMGLVYEELREMARQQLRNEQPGHTLNPTALVHEFYLRLIKQRRIHASYRTQFMGIASHSMRRILVDYARTRKRLKRGGGQVPVPLDEVEEFLTYQEADEVLALDEALERLRALNERAAEVVSYRFYSGLTVDETAGVLNVSAKTIQRDWLTARAWLRTEIAHDIGAEA